MRNGPLRKQLYTDIEVASVDAFQGREKEEEEEEGQKKKAGKKRRIDTAAATANGDHLTRNHAVSSLRSVVSADLKNAAPHTTPKTAQPQLYVIYIHPQQASRY